MKNFALLFVIIAAIAFGGVWLWRAQGLPRAALTEIEADIQQGRHVMANRKLVELLKRQPDCDQAVYLLGVCQKAQGRFELAFQTWGRVRPHTPFTVPSILERGLLLVTAGQLADAERLASSALDDTRIEPAGLRWFLSPIYWREGRREQARRLLRANWDELDFSREGTLDQAVKLVRMYVDWRSQATSTEELRGFLEGAGLRAPDDDRVWLGRANLAIRSGALDAAAGWIDRCLKRRPDDAAVWRARLDWAIAADQPLEAEKALARIPAGFATPVLIPALDAGFAAHHGDLDHERQALERLLAALPDQPLVLDRLMALGEMPNNLSSEQPDKAELATLNTRYRRLIDRNQPGRDSVELARIAVRLGRWFEAKAFATIAKATGCPVADLPGIIASLKAHETRQGTESRGGVLADLLTPPSGRPFENPPGDAGAAAAVIFND